jgi:hypothetical protein
MITEAKDLLEKVVKKMIPNATVVRSGAEESKQVLARKFPLAALITNPGKFDGTAARTYRYFVDEEKHKYKQRYARGNRNVPVLLRCWAANETEADKAFSKIIPAIPSRWNYDDFTGEIDITYEEHSDHAGNVTNLYCSVVEVVFTAQAAMDVVDMPYFNEVEMQGGEMEPRSKKN